MVFTDAVALTVAGAGCATDLGWRRVPNALTLGAAAAGVAYAAATGGLPGAGWALAGWAFGLAIFVPLFALGALGGGDVKLLAAIGAWVGPGSVAWVALYGAVAGGVLAVLVAWRRKRMRETLANTGAILLFWRVAGLRPHPGYTVDSPGAVTLPYALPIAVGLVVTLWRQ